MSDQENPESLALAVERVERFLTQRAIDISRGRRGSDDRIYFPWLIDVRASDLRALVDASTPENTA